ncbi:hypothetical protein CFC21_000397 [Triticum aestivum]|uniref:Protein kinase domain-containing protein n=1 Tax=Triticum aestivum TaxID=4565 RepID=A0A3B5XTK6_WHEAT|nr:hypothetical protein CFC21_000397 [Triticum aestivum]
MGYMEDYTGVYLKTSFEGVFTVSVKENNNSETDLHREVYKVGPLEIECMVKEHSNFMSYSVLSNFRHLNIVSVENFYLDKHGNGCMVLSSVDQTLRSWLLKVRRGGRKLKAFESTYMSSKLSKVFRKMAIGMCDVLESMFKIGIYPKSIRLADIYLVNHASPTVKILISEGTYTKQSLCNFLLFPS